MSMIWRVAEVNSGLGGKMKKRLQVLYINEQFGHFTNRKEILCRFYQPNQGCSCYLILRFLLVRRLISLSKLKGGGKYSGKIKLFLKKN